MKKALLIGIDYIDVSGISLKGCINDAINMRNMLIDAYDYEPENIVMLRDDDAAKFRSPTNDNIVYSIIDLVLESANLEEVWLHYSGHGSQIQKQNCDSEKSEISPKLVRSETLLKSSDYNDKNCINGDKMQILIPVDYKTNGCIVDKDLYDMVRRIKCRAILTFDCCHSGTVCDLPWTTEYQVPDLLQNADRIMLSPEELRKNSPLGMLVTTRISDAYIKNPNIFMFSGCRDDQTSLDTINVMDQRSGAFTNALCECLRKSHHNTSILSLHKDICIYLLERGYEQVPVLSSTVETPYHMFMKNQSLEHWPAQKAPSELSNLLKRFSSQDNDLISRPLLEKTEKLSDEQAATFKGYGKGSSIITIKPEARPEDFGRDPTTLHNNLIGHQYKNPLAENEGKTVWNPTGHHPTRHTKVLPDGAFVGFLPIISSGDSVSTTSTRSSGLSSLYRHFYKRKAEKL